MYKIHHKKKKRKTNLQAILHEEGLMQKDVAEEAMIADYQISTFCTGASNDMYLSTAKRICNAINILSGRVGTGSEYNLDDVFGD